ESPMSTSRRKPQECLQRQGSCVEKLRSLEVSCPFARIETVERTPLLAARVGKTSVTPVIGLLRQRVLRLHRSTAAAPFSTYTIDSCGADRFCCSRPSIRRVHAAHHTAIEVNPLRSRAAPTPVVCCGCARSARYRRSPPFQHPGCHPAARFPAAYTRPCVGHDRGRRNRRHDPARSGQHRACGCAPCCRSRSRTFARQGCPQSSRALQSAAEPPAAARPSRPARRCRGSHGACICGLALFAQPPPPPSRCRCARSRWLGTSVRTARTHVPPSAPCDRR